MFTNESQSHTDWTLNDLTLIWEAKHYTLIVLRFSGIAAGVIFNVLEPSNCWTPLGFCHILKVTCSKVVSQLMYHCNCSEEQCRKLFNSNTTPVRAQASKLCPAHSIEFTKKEMEQARLFWHQSSEFLWRLPIDIVETLWTKYIRFHCHRLIRHWDVLSLDAIADCLTRCPQSEVLDEDWTRCNNCLLYSKGSIYISDTALENYKCLPWSHCSRQQNKSHSRVAQNICTHLPKSVCWCYVEHLEVLTSPLETYDHRLNCSDILILDKTQLNHRYIQYGECAPLIQIRYSQRFLHKDWRMLRWCFQVW